MARKTKKQKETARLRREIEALRAELKKESRSQRVKESGKKIVKTDFKRAEIDLLPNLKKTALLALVSLAILSLLTLTQPHWPWLLSKLPF